MAKNTQKPAANDGMKNKRSCKKKDKKVAPLKTKKPTPSRAKKKVINPPSVIKIKIKPTSERNVLVPTIATGNTVALEEKKEVKNCNIKNLLSSGMGKTISLKRQAKSNTSAKSKATKAPALRSIKVEDGMLQQQEQTGAEKLKGTGRKCIMGKGKKNIKVSLQTMPDQMELDAIVKHDDTMGNDTPLAAKEINKKPKKQSKSLRLQRLNMVKSNAPNKDTEGVKTLTESVKEPVEDNKAEIEKAAVTGLRKRKIQTVVIKSEKQAKTKRKAKQLLKEGSKIEECDTNKLEKLNKSEEVENICKDKNHTVTKKKKTADQMANGAIGTNLTKSSIEMHKDNLTSTRTEHNFSPILSYLSLTAKPAVCEKDSKSTNSKAGLNDTLSVCSGFTWAREISSTSSTSSHATSWGKCIPINGKVPILKLGNIMSNLPNMSESIKNLHTVSQNEENTPESNALDRTKHVNMLTHLTSSTSSSSNTHTSSSNVSSSECTKTTTTKNISTDKFVDLEKVQNILQNIDFSWIDEIDQIFAANNFIKENCTNIISLSHCMSTDKEELQMACKNIQYVLEDTRISSEELPTVTPNLHKTDTIQKDVSSPDKEILNKPNVEIATPNYTTIPDQTYISSDFINIDDDVISLFAESFINLDEHTILAKKQIPSSTKLALPTRTQNIKTSVKTQITHTFTKPNETSSAINSTVTYCGLDDNTLKANVEKPTLAEKIVCKKQSADSTSLLRENKRADSETNSYSDPQESMPDVPPQKQLDMRENRRDEWATAEIPCSTIPNRTTIQPDGCTPKTTLMLSGKTKLSRVIFGGMCFRYLRYSCTNARCQYSHRMPLPEDINSRLSVVGTETCIHGYLIMKQYKTLCNRYLKVFIQMFASRKLGNILFEIMLDLLGGKMVTDTFDCMLMCLDELNNLDIVGCEYILFHILPDKNFFSEILVLFIVRSGHLLRYLPILTKLVTSFYERNTQLRTEIVNEFINAICANEFNVDHKQFLKLVYEKCVMNTHNQIFSTVPLTSWDKFREILVQVNLTDELEDLWLKIKSSVVSSNIGSVPEQHIQCSWPNSQTPVVADSSLLDVNSLKKENVLSKNPFIWNRRPYKPPYSKRNYVVNGPRVMQRAPQKKWIDNGMGANMEFRKSIQPNARFVTFGGGSQPANAFAPPD